MEFAQCVCNTSPTTNFTLQIIETLPVETAVYILYTAQQTKYVSAVTVTLKANEKAGVRVKF